MNKITFYNNYNYHNGVNKHNNKFMFRFMLIIELIELFIWIRKIWYLFIQIEENKNDRDEEYKPKCIL